MPKSKSPKLKLDPKNARSHDQRNLDLIDQSLEEVGAFRSIAVDGDDIIRAGNGVYQRAIELGYKVRVVDTEADELIAVRRPDLHGREAERAALLDNYVSDTSSWDNARLLEIAAQDADLLAGLWSEGEINDLRRLERESQPLQESVPVVTVNFAEQYQRKWGTEAGQVWRLPSLAWPHENHFLFIGDCRSEAVAAGLAQLGSVRGVFTSPPYAEQRAKKYGGIPPSEYGAWWEAVQANARKLLVPDGVFFLNLKAHCENNVRVTYVMKVVLDMAERWGWHFVDEFAWVKPGYPGDMGKRFKNGFEPIYMFAAGLDYKFRLGNVVEYRQSNFGGYVENLEHIQGERGTLNPVDLDQVRPSNVLHLMPDNTRNEESGGHPARFPPELPDFFLRAYSDEKDIWLDPFAGSGTTGIVAERLGRLSLLVELLPRYGATTLERWERNFGLSPELLTTKKAPGRPLRKK